MNAIQEKALSAVAEFLSKQQPELPGEVKDTHPFEEFSSLPPNVGQNGSTSRGELYKIFCLASCETLCNKHIDLTIIDIDDNFDIVAIYY